MAFVTGTATDHLDFWSKLLDFLQNNADLVAAGQQWTVAWQAPAGAPNGTDIVLKGPGLSGGDEVLVALRREDDLLTINESLVWISGCTGVLSSATEFDGHINSLSRPPAIFLDHAPMTYWFVANGRHFVVVVKLSTVYNAMYGGFFLPYSLPGAYPYPLFIGGSRGFDSNTVFLQPTTWRATETDRYRQFPYAMADGEGADPSACMLTPDGTWQGVGITYEAYQLPQALMGPRRLPRYFGDTTRTDTTWDSPTYESAGTGSLGYETVRSLLTAGLDGEFPLLPLTLNNGAWGAQNDPVTYGVLDGCFSVPGLGNAAENLITVGSVNHLVVQNVQRTDASEYWALALE